MHEQVIVAVESAPLTFGTWLRFMLGQRRNRLGSEVANALWIGLLFVLSAGLARVTVSVLQRAVVFVVAVGGVVATSLVLYAFVYVAGSGHGVTKLRWWTGYRTFLTFYWMTAPLAWLYAVPVERFLDPGLGNARPTSSLLAIVSVWRVLLITRAISVWLDAWLFKRCSAWCCFLPTRCCWQRIFLMPMLRFGT